MHRYVTFLAAIFLPRSPGQLKYYTNASAPCLVSQASGASYCTPEPTLQLSPYNTQCIVF
jgi:hypothetical protein